MELELDPLWLWVLMVVVLGDMLGRRAARDNRGSGMKSTVVDVYGIRK